MNVFFRYTARTLKKNRSRTVVTVIGIVLSMAMFTAVFESIFSMQDYLIRCEEKESGSYAAFYPFLGGEEMRRVEETKGVEDVAFWSQVGWAEADVETKDYKPYLLIKSISDNFTDLVAVRLREGRMPEREGELLLPAHLIANGGSYRVGERVSLSVGSRAGEGGALSERVAYGDRGEERIEDAEEKTYTVVGICERLSAPAESYGSAAYTALTVGAGGEPYGVFFSLEDTGAFYSFIKKNAVSDEWYEHGDLVRLYGALREGSLASVLYGFAAVLTVLIVFGSISLIYNSFAISVSERTRQFGILKSVGATKKQILSSVLWEALLLGGAGIPVGMLCGCGGLSLTFYFLRDAFGRFSGARDVTIRLAPSAPALLGAAAVCLVTVLISAWIPARRAIRVSPVDAIRQTGDVKIRPGSVRTSPLTAKLFGFEGMMASKNFKRNRKRYRSTVLSLFLSVTLFISASSFCSYLTRSVETTAAGDVGADVAVSARVGRGGEEELLRLFSGAAGVTSGSYYVQAGQNILFDPALITEAALQKQETEQAGTLFPEGGSYFFLYYLDDAGFRALCRENGADPDLFFLGEEPVALAFNRGVDVLLGENGRNWTPYEFFRSGALPAEGSTLRLKRMEHYAPMTFPDDPEHCYFFPEEYFSGHYDGSGSSLDRSAAIVLAREEAVEETRVRVAALSANPPLGADSRRPCLIFPYSRYFAMQGERDTVDLTLLFTSDDHARTAQEFGRLKETLSDTSPEIYDIAEDRETQRMLVTVVNVFSYGFITLISLIAVANVFNTISTSILLRRREFAMLRSIGLSERRFMKMMNYECVIYGAKGLLFGLPAAFLVTWALWRVTSSAFEFRFYVPWYSVAIAVGSVFAVVFATMLYAAGRIRRDNPVDALRNENL